METSVKERSSVLSRYFSEIREYPLLTKDEEMALADGVKRGDRASLNELIESNLSSSSRCPASIETSASVRGSSQRGHIGLIEAAHRYDASKGTKIHHVRDLVDPQVDLEGLVGALEPRSGPELSDEKGAGNPRRGSVAAAFLGSRSRTRRDLASSVEERQQDRPGAPVRCVKSRSTTRSEKTATADPPSISSIPHARSPETT